MVIRVAVIDDYQNAHTIGDWSNLASRIQLDVYTDTLSSEDSLVNRLEPYEIICSMRERTKFPPSLLDRLPNLRCVPYPKGALGLLSQVSEIKINVFLLSDPYSYKHI